MSEEQKEENLKEKMEDMACGSSCNEQQLEEYKDKYFRLLAELENMRKRLQKEKLEATRFAIENVLTDIILPIETLESALGFTQQMSAETRNWAFGFQMILTQFKEILHNHGIIAFSSLGESFDPHKHEAVEVVETKEHRSGTIIQEFSKGYKSADRTIRPARVKVARLPSLPNENENNQEEAQTEKMNQNIEE